jgi:hypothetical protein
MISTQESFRRLPVGIQVVLGFILLVLGAFVMLFANLWAQGDWRFSQAYFLIGILYLVNAVPVFLEGGMTMFYKKDVKAADKEPGNG